MGFFVDGHHQRFGQFVEAGGIDKPFEILVIRLRLRQRLATRPASLVDAGNGLQPVVRVEAGFDVADVRSRIERFGVTERAFVDVANLDGGMNGGRYRQRRAWQALLEWCLCGDFADRCGLLAIAVIAAATSKCNASGQSEA